MYTGAHKNAECLLWSTSVLQGLISVLTFNPLSPHDALKHHFTPLKTDLILLQPRVLE